MREWVYAVRWRYITGGGFDWYRDLDKAVIGLDKERQNIIELEGEYWRADLVPIPLPLSTPSHDTDAVTKYVDAYLEDMKL